MSENATFEDFLEEDINLLALSQNSYDKHTWSVEEPTQ